MSAILLDTPFKKQCLTALKLMYPNGLNSAQQHKDVIKVYIVGWGDALRQNNHLADLQTFAEEVKRIATDPNWWPDNSWCWWA